MPPYNHHIWPSESKLNRGPYISEHILYYHILYHITIQYDIEPSEINLILDTKFHTQLTIRYRTFIEPIAIVCPYV